MLYFTPGGGIGRALGWVLIGILYYSLRQSLVNWIISWLLHLIVTRFDSNTAVHPVSQILPIDTSKLCQRLSQICTLHASSGEVRKSSKPGSL